MTCWHDDWLLLSATIVHEAPSLALTIATMVQQVMRPAHDPLEPEPPPSPVVVPLPLLLPPPPPGEHWDEHICSSQLNVGPSQIEQAIV